MKQTMKTWMLIAVGVLVATPASVHGAQAGEEAIRASGFAGQAVNRAGPSAGQLLARELGAISRARGVMSRAQVSLARAQGSIARSGRAVARGQRSLAGYSISPALPLPPEAWAHQDPADSIYRAARRALNGRNYRDAVRMYESIRREYPSSQYVADSYYWQAQAHFRAGSVNELSRAQDLLAQQMNAYPQAATIEDARQLLARIQSTRAQRGDAAAAQAIARNASSQCDEDDSIRATALNALIRMDPERARPILMEVLQDRDECSTEMREQAIFLLARNADAETVSLLVDLAQRNPDPNASVREAAVFWLSQVPGDEAANALMAILDSDGSELSLREQALHALSRNDSEAATATIRRFATREDVPMGLRENAVFLLGNRPGGAAYLRDAFQTFPASLREQILFAVSRDNSVASRDWLVERALDEDEAIEVRKNALFHAGRTGLTLDEVLTIYRTADDLEMRQQAVFVISRKEGPEAVDALMEIARNEEDSELREQAVFWLGQSEDPRAADFLLELIRGGGGGE